jgi:hypothetical protein
MIVVMRTRDARSVVLQRQAVLAQTLCLTFSIILKRASGSRSSPASIRMVVDPMTVQTSCEAFWPSVKASRQMVTGD